MPGSHTNLIVLSRLSLMITKVFKSDGTIWFYAASSSPPATHPRKVLRPPIFIKFFMKSHKFLHGYIRWTFKRFYVILVLSLWIRAITKKKQISRLTHKTGKFYFTLYFILRSMHISLSGLFKQIGISIPPAINLLMWHIQGTRENIQVK